jgi:polyhydroxybutyrate depolymerase
VIPSRRDYVLIGRGLSISVLSLCVGYLCVGCASGDGPAQPELSVLAPGDYSFSLEVGTQERRYLVHVPASATPGQPSAVVVAFHGGGGNPEQFRSEAGLDSVSDREGFLVVYPAGSGVLETTLTWNAGPGCCGRARDWGTDDVGFVRALLEDLGSRHALASERVYLTGHSNGSMMAYRVAAEIPARIAGAVGVAGTLQLPAVQPTGPVPVLHIHSRDDPRAFYEGGVRDSEVVHPPVPEMLALWSDVNGCEEPPNQVQHREGAPGGPDSGHTATLLRWSCREGQLEHWVLTGAGHAWPGNRVTAARELIVGPSTEVISAAEEAWSFFESLEANR